MVSIILECCTGDSLARAACLHHDDKAPCSQNPRPACWKAPADLLGKSRSVNAAKNVLFIYKELSHGSPTPVTSALPLRHGPLPDSWLHLTLLYWNGWEQWYRTTVVQDSWSTPWGKIRSFVMSLIMDSSCLRPVYLHNTEQIDSKYQFHK